jgi:hypothetical protein
MVVLGRGNHSRIQCWKSNDIGDPGLLPCNFLIPPQFLYFNYNNLEIRDQVYFTALMISWGLDI